jgi:pyridoxine kinase
MARVLAVSSQVARGAIGLSAAVPALQAMGHETIPLPTILLSNHPGHVRFAGERVAPALLSGMLDALDANGWLAGIDAVLTGYLPSVDHVTFAETVVTRVRQRSPGARYLCDPVLGDAPKGLYIARDAAEAIGARLVPAADLLKMNRFEAAWLSGAGIDAAADVVAVARDRNWPTAVVTSVPSPDAHALTNLLVSGTEAPLTVDVARRDRVPNGTGDLLGALWLGYLLNGLGAAAAFERAVAGVDRVVARSLDADELQLASVLKEIAT